MILLVRFTFAVCIVFLANFARAEEPRKAGGSNGATSPSSLEAADIAFIEKVKQNMRTAGLPANMASRSANALFTNLSRLGVEESLSTMLAQTLPNSSSLDPSPRWRRAIEDAIEGDPSRFAKVMRHVFVLLDGQREGRRGEDSLNQIGDGDLAHDSPRAAFVLAQLRGAVGALAHSVSVQSSRYNHLPRSPYGQYDLIIRGNLERIGEAINELYLERRAFKRGRIIEPMFPQIYAAKAAEILGALRSTYAAWNSVTAAVNARTSGRHP